MDLRLAAGEHRCADSRLPWTDYGSHLGRGRYGPATPARSILLSIYLAILVVSLLLLRNPDPKLVAPLLLVQVIYKFSTPLTVGTLQNPVVLSNLGIAVLHTITLWVIWNSLKEQITN
jgi:hypothetical protein